MTESARVPDKLDMDVPDIAVLNRQYADASAEEVVQGMLACMSGRIALVSSFGAESALLLSLVAQADPATPVLFIDTQKHFPETLAYVDRLTAYLGLRDVRKIGPDPLLVAARDENGLRWSYDPDGCCDLRKVAPLSHALAGFAAWISGRKAYQASTRKHLPFFEIEDGRLKINPLARWTHQDIQHYLDTHALPRHPLESAGYASIGCQPCTSPVQPGEDPRAGRWRGWDKTECGLHKPAEDPVY